VTVAAGPVPTTVIVAPAGRSPERLLFNRPNRCCRRRHLIVKIFSMAEFAQVLSRRDVVPAGEDDAGSPGWLWLVPALTFGLAGFAVVAAAGSRLRSVAVMWFAAGYGVAGLVLPVLALLSPAPFSTAVAVVHAVVVWLGVTVHTVLLQQQLRPKPASVSETTVDPVIDAARRRAARREQLRELVFTDPGLAVELRIGRPDLPRAGFDDAGLVDVNHVPVSGLVRELGLTLTQAADIGRVREERGGFSTAGEIVLYCPAVTADRYALIADRLITTPM
jgi:hypothetical protein